MRYPARVRRYVMAVLVLAAAVATGASLYAAYAADREYSRLIDSGDQAVDDHRPFQALEAYSGAIALRPGSMLAHLKRGMAYRDRGEFDAAASDLRRAHGLDPTSTVALEQLGDVQLATRHFDRAIERYEAYLAIDDRSAPVWYKLGLALYRDGHATRATDALQRSVALNPDGTEAHLLLGLCLRDLGESVRARQSLETAANLAPALIAAREALAGLYADEGDHARAVDQLEALAALDSTRPARFVALGLAHARARRHAAAVLTLSRAVERFPNDAHVYAALGRVWLEDAETTGDVVALRKAVAALLTAASHADVTSDTLTDLGRAWQRAGDADAAARAWRQAVARLPARPAAYLLLADLCAQDRRFQEARDLLIRYAALVGGIEPLAAVATRIAAYSIQLGEPQLALRWIDRAMDDAGETAALAALRRRAIASRSSDQAGRVSRRPES